ncbi:alpha/beta hydrolase family protein [Blastopirellula marina]|nr:prolyl oligopeptidase family serine peptidase [Blastopirellula marina]
MSLRLSITLSGLLLLSIGLVGCSNQVPVNGTLVEEEIVEKLLGAPDRLSVLVKQTPDGNYSPVGNGVRRAIVKTRMPNGGTMTLWVYQPDSIPGGKLPCVFIAPANTRMVHGSDLKKGSENEHIPWAQAGFAVVAYELSGDPGSDDASNGQLQLAAEEFRAAKSGLLNAQIAMAYAKEKLSFVDSRRFYTVGYDSAGTMALYVAEMDPQVKASVALMPAVDVRAWLGVQGMTKIQRNNIVPDAGAYVSKISPATHIARLSQPTFLLYMGNDDKSNWGPAEQFAKQMQDLGKDITVVKIPTGKRYETMIEEAIPLAIQWLKMVDSMN